jgi:hypothetical protein
MDKYILEIEVDLRETDPNRTRGQHWTQVRRRWSSVKKDIQLLTAGRRPAKPLESFRVSIVRYAVKEMDWDNLVASLKPAIDALHRFQIIKNDSWKYIKGIDIEQVKSKEERKLVIRVEET